MPCALARRASTALAQAHPKTPPNASHAALRRDTDTERPGLASRPFRAVRGKGSARALERAAIAAAHHLMLEALEEELATAAWTERLVRLVPLGSLAARARVRGTELLDGRLATARRHEDLPQSVAAEIAVELSTCRHRETS